MTRQQRAAQVAELRAQGLTYRQIATQLGISRSHANALVLDPDGSQDHARKQSYGRLCANGCGRYTNGGDGPGKASRYCNHCAPGIYLRKWTRENIIAAIQEWARRHGHPPSSTEWVNRTVADDGYEFPPRSAVYDSSNGNRNPPFAQWADAIEAAGFPRPYQGIKHQNRKDTPVGHPTVTRTYLVFTSNGDNTLHLVGEYEATNPQDAIEQTATDPGEYSAVAKASLQTFTLRPRLVAERHPRP